MSKEKSENKIVKKKKRFLSEDNLSVLVDVPSEYEWLDNLRIKSEKTAHAYEIDINEFKSFVGIKRPRDYRLVKRRHVMQWMKHLSKQKLNKTTIARKYSALSSLFKYYCGINAVKDSPVVGVNRPKVSYNTGKTPAISTLEAKKLLESPPFDTIKGKRDRAILATFLFHGLRRAELSGLKVKDIQSREGVPFLRIEGKGEKERYIPLHPAAMQKIYHYLESDNRKGDNDSPLFCPLKRYRNIDGDLKPITTDGIYKIVMYYALKIGIDVKDFSPHSLRATATTNALSNNADIAKVQMWLGHSNIQTTRLYDKRDNKPEDSPTFKVSY